MVGAVSGANSSVQSYAAAPANGEMWSVLQVSPALPSIDVVKGHVDFVQQLRI